VRSGPVGIYTNELPVPTTLRGQHVNTCNFVIKLYRTASYGLYVCVQKFPIALSCHLISFPFFR
jgi:hypothetical protein